MVETSTVSDRRLSSRKTAPASAIVEYAFNVGPALPCRITSDCTSSARRASSSVARTTFRRQRAPSSSRIRALAWICPFANTTMPMVPTSPARRRRLDMRIEPLEPG